MLGGPNKFEEADKEKLVEFLNFVTAHATFTLDVKEAIKLRDHLAWCQQSLLKKINDNIVGDMKVHENVIKPEPKKKSKKASK